MRRILIACWLLGWLGWAALPGMAEARDNAVAGTAIGVAELPPEARETLRLIERGGPFPYRRDGVVFGNREHRLPLQRHGYYREYTVPTPGSRDRGARRIVAGSAKSGEPKTAREYYYSDDHYRSFRSIRE